MATTPFIWIEDLVVGESDGLAVFYVRLNAPSNKLITVDFKTVDGAATSGLDYSALSGTLAFAPGETVKTVSVPILNDGSFELPEGFQLQLLNSVNAVLDPTHNPGSATIIDNDATAGNPSVSVGNISVDESAGTATFYIILDRPPTNNVTVTYSTADGSAKATTDPNDPQDYMGIASGSITFAAGQVVQKVSIALNNDVDPEPEEYFTLNLLSATTNDNNNNDVPLTLSNATGTAFIAANDTVTVSNPVVEESEGFARFIIALNVPAATDQTYSYVLVAGDATAGSDYVIPYTTPPGTGSVTINAGQSSAIVSVPLINDTIPEGAEQFSLVLSPLNGSFVGGVSGTATIKASDQPGVVATDDTATTDQNKPVTIAILSNDSNPNNDVLTITTNSQPAHGTVVLNSNTGTAIYTPSTDYVGADSFTYTLKDGQGQTSTALVSITVGGTPTAVADAITTIQDKAASSINLLTNDKNPANGVLTVKAVDGVAVPVGGSLSATTAYGGGTVVIKSDGTATYTPKAGFSGSDSFTYTLQDSDGRTSTSTVAVTVTSDTPTAVADSLITSQNTAGTITVLANDLRPATGAALSVTGIAANPTNGTAIVTSTGQVIYTPAKDYIGTDSFQYTISTPSGHTATGMVNVVVAVSPQSPAPVAVNEDTTTVKGVAKPINLLADSIYPNHSTLTVNSFTQPAHGTVAFNAAGVGTYTPNDAVYVGADSFTYTIKDNLGRTSTAVVNVTVTNGTALTVAKDTAATLENQAVNIKVLDNDSLPAGSTTMSVTAVATPAHGTAAFGFDGTDWRVTYTPALNYTGSDSFTYTVKDDKNNTATGTVNVTVTGGSGVAVTDALTTSQDRQATFSLLSNDVDPNNGTTGGLYVVFVNAAGVGEIGDTGLLTKIGVTQSSTQAGGQVTIDSYGKGTYVPKAGYVGPDSFTYTLRDNPFNGFYHLSTATVNIAVSDGTPRATADTATTVSGSPVAVNVLGNDTDPNFDALIVSAVSAPARGTAVNGGGGFVIYTPAQNFSGIDSFTYTVSDGSHTSTGVVSVTVTPATTGAAVAKDQAFTTGEDTPSKIDLLKDATNPNKETLTLKAGTVTTAHGKAEIDAGGFAIYTPSDGYVGPDYFNFTMVDSQGRTSAGLVSVTVTQQRPTAVDDSAATSIGQPVNIKVLDNDSDPQKDPLTVSAIKTLPANGTVTIASDGKSITYTPAANFSGSDRFVYTNSDGKGYTASATVNVKVTPGTPIATDDNATTSQGVPVEISVLDNDSDPEGNPLSVVAVSVPGRGTAVLDKGGIITYTPSSGFYGLDTFGYTISDGQGHTATAFVDVLVSSVNRAPTLANPIPDQTGIPTQTFFRYTLPANTFSDPDLGDVLTYSARLVDGSALPSWLVFDPGSHNFLGSPGDGDVGSFNVKVTATDRSFSAVSDTFTVSVVPRTTSTTTTTTTTPAPNTQTDPGTPAAANHAPATADNAASLKEGGAYAFAAANFPFSDADAGDSLQSVTIVSLPTDGQLKLAGSLVQAGQSIARADLDSGRLTYAAPALVKDWAQSFVFQVGDGKAASSNTGLFSLNLVPSGAATRGTDAGERLKGAGKADLLLGQSGDDTLDGKGGGDRLYGEAGNDVLKGGAGNDFLSGGAGNDKLYGQDGKDILAGGAGNDFMDGGAAKDVYLYGSKQFGAGDLSPGDHDIIKATKGDCIAFDASLWAHLTNNGSPLDDLAGKALTSQISAQSNIAYDGHSVMIDLNGDGDFIAAQDLAIEILGQAQKVAVDPTGQFLVIG